MGKSHFLLSLAHVVTRVARPTTCVVYVDFKTVGAVSLFAAIRDALGDIGVVPPPAYPGVGEKSALHCFLLESGRRVFVVIDGVEELHKHNDSVSDEVWRELYFIGEMIGDRTMMAIITGRAAVLHALVYEVPGCCNSLAAQDYPHAFDSAVASTSHRLAAPCCASPVARRGSTARWKQAYCVHQMGTLAAAHQLRRWQRGLLLTTMRWRTCRCARVG